MIYKFSMDEALYEAEVTITQGCPATNDEPADGPEIEVEHIWILSRKVRHEITPIFSSMYADLEQYVLDNIDDVLEKAGAEADADEADAADARNDARKEDL